MKVSISYSTIATGAKTQDHPAKALALVYNPPGHIKESMGELFICSEPISKIEDNFTRLLVNGAGKAFYNSLIKNQPEKRFRDAIRGLNELLSSAPKQETAVALMAVVGQAIFYASCNGLQITLKRQDKLIELAQNKNVKFQQIGSGEIKTDDQLLICSNEVAKKLGSSIFSTAHKGLGKNFEKKIRELALDKNISYLTVIIAHFTIKNDIPAEGSLTGSPDRTNKNRRAPQLKTNALTYPNKFKVLISQIFRGFRKKQLPNFINASKKWWTNIWTKYVNPNPKKAFIVAIMTTVILVAITWLIISANKSVSGTEKALSNAQILLDSADKAENNNNIDSARRYLNQARSTLDGISKQDQKILNSLYDKKSIKTSYALQISRLEAIQDRIEFVKRITTDVSFEMGVSDLAYMYYFPSRLVGIDKNNGSIVEINPLFGSPTVKATSTDLKSAYSFAPIAESLLILSPSGITQFDGTANLVPLKVSGLPQSKAIDTFLNYVYLLSPNDNQVVRFTKSATTLSAKTSLLKNVTPNKLNNTSSMVVIGNIFIPKNNTILLFEGGEERTFKLKDLPASFGDIKSLLYNPSKNYFVALNAKSSRIAILQLEVDSANFKNSYALQGDANISSFALDEKTSQIFVNSGSKLYSFNLEKK